MDALLNHMRRWGRKAVGLFRKNRDIQVDSVFACFPDAPYTKLLPEQTVVTPELADATCVPDIAHYAADTYTCPAVYAIELCDVLFCPVNNVVMTDDGRVAAESITSIARPEYLDDHALSARRVTSLPGTHTALRSRFNHYYHHLIDHASRLYFLSVPPLDSHDQIGLLLRSGSTDFEQYLLERLCPPHAHVVSLHRRTLYRIERYVLITPMTRRHAGYQRQPYLSAFEEAFQPSRPSTKAERIYVSRRGQKGRIVKNEDAVLRALRPLGFERYFLEDLSFSEQSRLFYDADAVVAPHGAGLSNLIYSKHARVVEYFPSCYVVPSFYFLAKSKGLGYRRLHACEDWRDDNFEMDVDQLLCTLTELGIDP